MLGDPFFNVAFTTTDESGLDIFLVNDFMASRRWRLNGLQKPSAVHFCVTRPEHPARGRRHVPPRSGRGHRPRPGATVAPLPAPELCTPAG